MNDSYKVDSEEDITSSIYNESMLSPNKNIKSVTKSEISEESALEKLLDTGRLKKKFSEMKLIGEGAFGKVYKAKSIID